MLIVREMIRLQYKIYKEGILEEKNLYLLLCVILVFVLIICIFILVKMYLKLSKQNENLMESISNLGKLNDKLRMDRHDYLNHMQVVYGLMELEEYDEMASYLKKIYKEMLKTGKAIKTSKPAINALLAAKTSESDSKGIELLIEVKSDLKNLHIEDWELCKILSNIIDNAERALGESEKNEKKIRVNINETKEEYILDIENNGPEIPEELMNKIFKKGFTSKKEEGHGMGLAIVSEIVEANKGEIGVKSDETMTIFTVKFKKGE